MLEITVQVKEDHNLPAIINRAGNLGQVFQKIQPLMIRSVHQNFDVGGRPPWKPLALSTIIAWVGGPHTPHRKTWFTQSGKLTQKAGGYVATRRPLYDTGALKRSVREGTITPLSVSIVAGGGAVPYAPLHQFGGKTGKGLKVTIPARPFMLMQDNDRQKYIAMISSYITKGK